MTPSRAFRLEVCKVVFAGLTRRAAIQPQVFHLDTLENELKYWVAFHRISGLGPARFAKLESHFGNLEEAWNSSPKQLSAAGLDARTTAEVQSDRPRIDPDGELDALYGAGVRAIHLRSDEYPHRLREIFDPPSVIYVRGNLLPEDERGVAVVGTRRASPYGREMARRLAGNLAASGVSVLSGLARGIDGIAHQAALDAGGRTIAVVGGGLDSVYPPEHADLASRICERGAIISEYPLGKLPQAQHFPRRNRVISGLSLGVLVVEAGMKSGAMLTVRWALDQDREVFAVPGPAISENSAGTNWLIQQGAKLVVDHNDVLDELNIAGIGQQLELDKAQSRTTDATGNGSGESADGTVCASGISADNGITHNRILAALCDLGGQAHVDDLIRTVGLPPADVMAGLTVLELEQKVRQSGGMQFVLGSDRARQQLRDRLKVGKN